MKSAEKSSENGAKAIIFHYHFFKNSGTSLDFILQRSFLNRWCSREFYGDRRSMEREAASWIDAENEMTCFSSHTYSGRPPSHGGLICIPVFFIRHPLDRLVSVYEYERKQNAPGYGPEMAKRFDLIDYVVKRNNIDSQLSNFHLNKLSEIFCVPNDVGEMSKLLDALPFVGVVDFFDKSMQSLAKVLNGYGFSVSFEESVYENVNRDVFAGLDSRLDDLRKFVGNDFYSYLEDTNKSDLELYEKAKYRLLNFDLAI